MLVPERAGAPAAAEAGLANVDVLGRVLADAPLLGRDLRGEGGLGALQHVLVVVLVSARHDDDQRHGVHRPEYQRQRDRGVVAGYHAVAGSAQPAGHGKEPAEGVDGRGADTAKRVFGAERAEADVGHPYHAHGHVDRAQRLAHLRPAGADRVNDHRGYLRGEDHQRVPDHERRHAGQADAVAAVHPAVLEKHDHGHYERRRHLVEHALEQYAHRLERAYEQEVHVRHLEDAHARGEAGVCRHQEHQREVADDYGAQRGVGSADAAVLVRHVARHDDQHQQRRHDYGVDELGRGAEHSLYAVLELGECQIGQRAHACSPPSVMAKNSSSRSLPPASSARLVAANSPFIMMCATSQ